MRNKPFEDTTPRRDRRRLSRAEARKRVRAAIRTARAEAEAADSLSQQLKWAEVGQALELYPELEAELDRLAKVTAPEAWGLVRPVASS